MDSTTARTPSLTAAVSASSSPSSTRATSLTRTGWPSMFFTTSWPSAAGDSTRPLMLSEIFPGPFSTAPPGMVTFWPSTVFCTSAAVRPVARRAIGSSQMLIWRLRPPRMVTCPTPATFSSRRRMTLSAISVISRTGLSAWIDAYSTGVASGSIFWITGVSAPTGSWDRMVFTRSRTSCAATSAFFSSTN